MDQRICPICEASLEGAHASRRFCSDRCRYRSRDLRNQVPCSSCGESTWPSRHRPQPTCQPCRRRRPEYRDKSPKPPQSWSCAKCGSLSERPATRGQRPRLCTSCRTSHWITNSERHSIYQRDSWTCWLCLEVVDHSLIGTTSEWRPSLDHITPRSHGGSNHPDNLRLAHFWCNVIRRDDRYAPEDFRVSG